MDVADLTVEERLAILQERFGQIIAERDRDREALRLIVEEPGRAVEIASARLQAATDEKAR